MDMVRRVRRLKRVGFKALFWRASRWILRRETVLVMAVVLDEPWRERPPTVPDRPALTFRWLDGDSLDVLRAPDLGYEDQATLDRSLGRLERGDECLVGLVDGEPVTYMWLTHGVREVVGDELKLSEGQVWIYKSFTHPAWRRQGLTQLLGRHALERCMAQGDRVGFVDMVEVNRPSVAAFRGIGFRTLGRFVARTDADGGLRADVPTRLLDRIGSLPSEQRAQRGPAPSEPSD
jgi:GNAT superfamily N-acetyltransferase